jgi:hypothetical protein
LGRGFKEFDFIRIGDYSTAKSSFCDLFGLCADDGGIDIFGIRTNDFSFEAGGGDGNCGEVIRFKKVVDFVAENGHSGKYEVKRF